MLLRKKGEIAPERMKSWVKAEMTLIVDVSGGKSKVQCCKEQYYIRTWNVRFMNQGKLNMVKKEMT